MELTRTLSEELACPGTGWSMGSFGAIAEFHHVAGDPEPRRPGDCAIVTARGGLRLDPLNGVRAIAWEALSPRPDRWQQGVSLCLPASSAAMNGRAVLTELGPDREALRAEDRGAILFDMGLAQLQVDFCVRTADPDLLAVLRAAEGQALSDPACRAMPAILAAHPHRVAVTRIGRVEVFQKIGGPDTGGASPVGPHTHVLPQLLRAGRTHSANIPLPQGFVPVAGMHPESAVMDSLGHDRAFDAAAFARFQAMLDAWGAPERVALKRRVRAALRSGEGPEAVAVPDERFARTALRVALRQALREEGETVGLSAWLAAFDRSSGDADPDAAGHAT